MVPMEGDGRRRIAREHECPHIMIGLKYKRHEYHPSPLLLAWVTSTIPLPPALFPFQECETINEISDQVIPDAYELCRTYRMAAEYQLLLFCLIFPCDHSKICAHKRPPHLELLAQNCLHNTILDTHGTVNTRGFKSLVQTHAAQVQF